MSAQDYVVMAKIQATRQPNVEYEIRQYTDGYLECTCLEYLGSRAPQTCKHLRAYSNWIEPMATPLPAEVVVVTFTAWHHHGYDVVDMFLDVFGSVDAAKAEVVADAQKWARQYPNLVWRWYHLEAQRHWYYTTAAPHEIPTAGWHYSIRPRRLR